jgi:hypothetical protein
LTAVDGYPVTNEEELKEKLVWDDFCENPMARLRFEVSKPSGPRRPFGSERMPLSPYAYSKKTEDNDDDLL